MVFIGTEQKGTINQVISFVFFKYVEGTIRRWVPELEVPPAALRCDLIKFTGLGLMGTKAFSVKTC